jgi:hypothetical protein
MTGRPSKPARWATSPGVGYPGAVEPDEAKKDNGFANGEAPGAGHFDWLFQHHADWIRYLDVAQVVHREFDAWLEQTDVSPSGSDQLEAFAINPDTGTIIAVGSNGAIKRSTDFGATWTTPTADDSYADEFACVAFGDGKWVIGGQGGEIQVSTDDGETWTSHTSGTSAWRSIAFDGTTWVIVATVDPEIRTSTNAITWDARTTTGAGAFYSVAHHGGRFIAMSSDGGVVKSFYSTDSGTTWASVTLSDYATSQRVLWAPPLSAFVALANDLDNYYLLSSADGITWTEAENFGSYVTFAALAVVSSEHALYVVSGEDIGGMRVLGDHARTLPGAPTLTALSQRLALLESTTPRVSLFIYASSVAGDIRRSRLWSPP